MDFENFFLRIFTALELLFSTLALQLLRIIVRTLRGATRIHGSTPDFQKIENKNSSKIFLGIFAISLGHSDSHPKSFIDYP